MVPDMARRHPFGARIGERGKDGRAGSDRRDARLMVDAVLHHDEDRAGHAQAGEPGGGA
jgi:hypothetical protein